MNRRNVQLRLILTTGVALLALLLFAGCLNKPVKDAQVVLSGDSVTFPAYSIKAGELEAPAQGPYTKFAGAYPAHWPKEWKLDARFYTPGGAIPEVRKSVKGTDAATFEFDGAFQGTPDELEQWFREQAQAVGIEITSNQLSTTFQVIERRKLELPPDAWEQAGLAGEVVLNYGPRYADYTHLTFTIVKYLSGVLEEPAPPQTSMPPAAETYKH